MKEFPSLTRDDIVKQMISMRKRFQNYKSFAVATMDSIITPEMRKGSIRLKANMLQSCYLRNNGKGKFDLIPLPFSTQTSQLDGMVVDDFDGDGNLDIAISGNDYGTEVSTGRYDAFNGLLLKGDGKGGFGAKSILESGIYIPGDGKALVKLRSAKGGYLLAASQNRDALKVFELKHKTKIIPVLPLDQFAIITYKTGKKRKEEFYNGTSFLSQSGRFILFDDKIQSVLITDITGKERNVTPNK